MGVGYQKFQAGSPNGYLNFGVISTPGGYSVTGSLDLTTIWGVVSLMQWRTQRREAGGYAPNPGKRG